MPYPDASSRYDDCQVCHLPAAGHLRCSACGILAGPGHLERHLIDGVCWTCQRASQGPSGHQAREADYRSFGRLAVAVIAKALRDASYGNEIAHRWLVRDSYERDLWCDMAGLDPAVVGERAAAIRRAE